MLSAQTNDLRKKYTGVAANYLQNRAAGYKHLCSFEPFTIRPQDWSMDVINQYDSYITFNERFCKSRGILRKSFITKGCCNGDILYELDNFKSYEEKIKGVCVLGKYGRIDYRNREGSIYFLRQELLENLRVEPFLVKHLFAHDSWGGSCYQGRCDPYDPWGISPLKKVSEYLFCFCPENTYHLLWSWGYLTERLQRCFKAKTIAIYIGCYNIEDLVPKDLFIDFRDFYRDYKKLAEYLITFSKEKYMEMTERAHQWEKTCTIRLDKDLDSILKLAVEYP